MTCVKGFCGEKSKTKSPLSSSQRVHICLFLCYHAFSHLIMECSLPGCLFYCDRLTAWSLKRTNDYYLLTITTFSEYQAVRLNASVAANSVQIQCFIALSLISAWRLQKWVMTALQSVQAPIPAGAERQRGVEIPPLKPAALGPMVGKVIWPILSSF